MTLLDLCKLIKRNAAMVVAIPVICAVVCAGVIYSTPKTYEATATLTSGSDISGVTSAVKSAAASTSNNGATIEVTATTSSKSFSIVATANDSADAISAANKALESATETARNTYIALGTATPSLSATQATTAADTSPSIPKYAVIAFLVGLFVAICIVIIKDIARGPLHNSREIEELFSMRKLGYCGDNPSEYQQESLLINTRNATANSFILAPASACQQDSDTSQGSRFGIQQPENSGEGIIAEGVSLAQTAKSKDSGAAHAKQTDVAHINNCAVIVGVGDPSLSVKTCCNLGAAAEAANTVTLIIDANLRQNNTLKYELAHALGVTDVSMVGGIADVITGAGTIDQSTLQLTDNVFLLPSGGNYTSAVSVLDSDKFADLLQSACKMFDFVIVNTPDATLHSDYAYVCNQGGTAVFAVQELKTRRADFEEALERLVISRSPIAGFASSR